MRYFLVIALVFSLTASAQEKTFTYYTTANGLPSNFIYSCMEDDRGFLWIATDAGLTRFDGKNFVTYDTKKGLPDTEILGIVKDGSGKIWLKIFKRGACYYDEKNDRFVSEKDDPELKLTEYSVYYLNRLSDGSIAYSGLNSEVFKNGKKNIAANGAKFYSGSLATVLVNENEYITAHGWGVNYWIKGDLVDSLLFFKKGNAIKFPVSVNDTVYYFNPEDNGVSMFWNFSFKSNSFNKYAVILPEAIRTFNICGNYLWASTLSGRILKLNRFTLQTEDVLNNGVTNSVYTDSKENTWICTVDKGLIKISKQAVKRIALPDDFSNRNFLSISKWNNKIYAGNYNGEVIESNFSSVIVHPINLGNYGLWVRQILPTPGGLLIGGEGGILLNFSRLKNHTGQQILSSKVFALLDENNLVIAQTGALSEFNFSTKKNQRLVFGRATAVTIDPDKKIYYGTTESLFRFQHYDTIPGNRVPNPKLLNQRITCLYTGKDSLLWAGTPSDGVFVFKNDSLIAQISTADFLLSNAIKNFHSEKPGTVWAANIKGISAIDYAFKNNKFYYTIRNVSVADGLLSPQINALWVENDTVYAASANGINYFSANIRPAENKLQVYITGFSLNGKDTSLVSGQSFNYYFKNVVLRFSAPEINGSSVSYQYNINEAGWQDNSNGVLELPQLKDGHYSITLRAIDVNGKPSSIETNFSFTIRPAWWQTWWFRGFLFLIALSLLVYVLQRRNRDIRNRALDKMASSQRLTDLELQAVKAQINPHFIFNCLNSIKSLIHQQRYDEADKYLDDFSYLLRSTIDHSSQKMITLADEIKYIDNYLRLEQLRFGKKMKYLIGADGIETTKIAVPSMLLQPYAENAIKHGIRNLPETIGHVIIRFSQTAEMLSIHIDDNGVGREVSSAINAANPNYHHSVGLSLTGKREELFGIVCNTIDKKDKDGKSDGTTVVLEMPLHYI